MDIVSRTGSGRGGEDVAPRTFLIADIRGYTVFTRTYGDAAAARLAIRFADVARDAVSARSGTVLELRGDEVLAVFSTPAQAIRSALELQAACREETTQDPTLPLLIGIGIDSGEAVPVEGGFRGAALNMAARLCAKATAGEVLITTTASERAGTISGIRFEERGKAEIKGFDQPVDLLRVSWPGLTSGVEPPTAGSEASLELLPPELDSLTPMVDREIETHWLRGTWRQAARGMGRLVFVSGPAGIGKTRLLADLAGWVHERAARVRYAGAGGAGAALAIAGIRESVETGTPTLLVVNDLEALGDGVIDALADVARAITDRRTLIVGAFRNVRGLPSLASLIEEVDNSGDGHRSLPPLDATGVADVLRLYAGDEIADAPIESMRRASGGVPRRVHEVVSEWARDEAKRRLVAAAEWLAAGRDRHTGELEFANNVIALRLARLYDVETSAEVDTSAICPFKGLASFEVNDAPYFFGRERLVGEIAARTVGVGLLGIIGPSGSGKSSLVLAGLIPSLAAGLLPGSERWRHVVLRPGEHPVSELRRSLLAIGVQSDDPDPLRAVPDHLEPDGRLILVIDQFEELFGAAVDDEERRSFTTAIVRAAKEQPDRVIIVPTIRADFYGHCAADPEFARLLGANQVLLGTMSTEELQRAVELPARRVGLRVESALTEALIDEVVGEPGGLPLLSTSLVELWQERDSGWLRIETYEAKGGVSGAVARLADRSFAEFTEGQREVAKTILLRLVGSGEGDAAVRRRVPTTEFDLDRDEAVSAVLARLTEDRLLIRTNGQVELAHEALIREWPRFRAWLQEDVQGRALRSQLTEAANRWQETDRDPADLFRGPRLSATLEWTATHGQELNELERTFLDESKGAGERESQRIRSSNRRLRASLSGVALLLVLALIAGSLFLVQRRRAENQARVAEAQRLGALAVGQDQLDLSLLLAREAVNLDDSVETRGALLTSLLRSPQAIGVLSVGDSVLQIALTGEGRTIAVLDTGGGVHLFDPATRARRDIFFVAGANLMVPSPDGRTLAVQAVGGDGASLQLWDTVSATLQREIRLPGFQAFSVAFSPDGTTVGAVVGSNGDEVLMWNTRTGARSGPRLRLGGTGERRWALAFTPSGELVTTEDTTAIHAAGKRTILWDLRSREPGRTYPFGGPMALSPDGRTVALVNDELTLLDLRSGRTRALRTEGQPGLGAVAFSPDGNTVVAGTQDGTAIEWDVASGRTEETLRGPSGGISSLAFGSDGNTLYAAGTGPTLLILDVQGRRRLGRPLISPPATRGFPLIFALSPVGSRIAIASGRDVLMFDTRTLTRSESFTRVIPRRDQISRLAFSPDGTELAVSGYGGITVLDHDTGSTVARIAGSQLLGWADEGSTLWGVKPSRSIQRGGIFINLVQLVRLNSRTGASLPVPEIGEHANLYLSPDGTMLATSGPERRMDVWNIRAPRKLFSIPATPFSTAVFSREGHVLATSGISGRRDEILFWRTPSGGRVGKALTGPVGIAPIAFDSTGSLLATGSSNGEVQLWDVASHRQISSFPEQTSGGTFGAGFSPDGTHLAILYGSGRHYLWDIDAANWKARACDVAGRSLSAREWTEFIPERPFELVCPSRAPDGGEP